MKQNWQRLESRQRLHRRHQTYAACDSGIDLRISESPTSTIVSADVRNILPQAVPMEMLSTGKKKSMVRIVSCGEGQGTKEERRATDDERQTKMKHDQKNISTYFHCSDEPLSLQA